MLTRATTTLGLLALLVPAQAQAQTAGPARVELELFGGVGRAFDAGATPLAAPAAGAPIGTSSPLFPSRRVSTWFFGDGADLLNAAAADLDLVSRLTPLDAAAGAIGHAAETRGSFGARLRIRTTPSVWMEVGLESGPATSSLPGPVADAVEATRASFVSVFAELLASGPFTNRSVTATVATADGAARDVTASLAANLDFASRAGFTPYVTLGAGIVRRAGEPASVTLTGRYAARILGSSPIDETDRVTLQSRAGTGIAAIGGAGLARATGRVSLRLDGRLIATNRTTSVTASATPTVAAGTPADFIESYTNPSIQFSNNAATGRRSTLSGDAWDQITVAKTTRLQIRALVTIGVAVRF